MTSNLDGANWLSASCLHYAEPVVDFEIFAAPSARLGTVIRAYPSTIVALAN